jgi:ATP-dependent DNA ligase
MARRDELLEQCKELGVEPEKSRNRVDKETKQKYKESTVKDCEKAIQQYYIKKYTEESRLNPLVLDILNIDSPMLALQSKDKKLDSIRDSLWEDNNNYVFQEKIDGCRCMLCYHKDHGWDFYSRNLSVSDCLPISYRTKLLVPPMDNNILQQYGIESFIIDTELVPLYNQINTMADGTELVAETQLNLVTSILGSLDDLSHKMQETNPLKFIAFDIIKLNNNWLVDLPLSERNKFLEKMFILTKQAGLGDRISLVPSTMTNKEQFYNNIISVGGEGVVAKDLNSKYDTLGKRAGEWIKLKRTVSQSLLMEEVGDTIDAFITGYKLGNEGTNRENQVSAFEFSIYLTDDNNEYLLDETGNPIVHHIATMSGLTDELRQIATKYDAEGKAILNPIFMGKVAEIDGQDISSKNYRFAHAVFKGWRPDRSAESCKMQKSILERLVL